MVNLVLKDSDYSEMINENKKFKQCLNLLKQALLMLDVPGMDICTCPTCDQINEIREFVKENDN